MTNSRADVRKGSQLPRIESYPLYHTTAGDDAIDLAAVAGLVLDPWQQHVLRASLGERVDGRWSAFRSCLVVPRQNGKNALLEARELAGLFLFNEKLIFHTAHEFKTTRESMRSMMARIKGAPELLERVAGFEEGRDPEREVAGMKTGNVDPSITLKSGNRLVYAARSKGSGRGFTGDLVVLDEAYALKIEEIAALVPTMAAKSIEGNPQVWFTSSAGMADSDLLASYRKQGIDKSSARLAYFEWSADDAAGTLDREAWYRANPGLGYRISEEFVQDEYETMLTETGDASKFRRERLGIWEELGAEHIFPKGLWGDRITADQKMVGTPTISVDMRTGMTQCVAVAACGLNAAGERIIDMVQFFEGAASQWSDNYIVDAVSEILDAHDIHSIALDGLAENETIAQRFRDRGLVVLALNTRDMANGAVGLTDALINDRVRHTNNEHLNRAVAGAAKRDYGDQGLYLWSLPKSSVDITALRAATVAWWVNQSEADYDLMDSFG